MRRFAGSWVREQGRKRLLLTIAVLSGMIGFTIGTLLDIAISFFLGPSWITYSFLPIALACLVYILWAARRMDRGDIAAWLKGAESEAYVGQAIEYAITAPNCAVVHSVTELTGAGDIDHLVATPSALWIIETKHRRVPQKMFPRTLSAIARKMKEARAWAPPGTPVRGCLVVANPEGAMQPSRQASGETIFVRTAGSLAKALAEEAGAYPSVSPKLASAVWQLGRVGN